LKSTPDVWFFVNLFFVFKLIFGCFSSPSVAKRP